MRSLVIQSAIAGLIFGFWPIMMNRSRLTGTMSPVIFTGFAFLVVLPFALRARETQPEGANWLLGISAGIVGGLALIVFNGMLAKATREQISSLFVIAIVTQTAVPAIYQTYVTKGMPLGKGIGFAAAILAAILLA